MQNQRDTEARERPLPLFRYALAAPVAETAKVAPAISSTGRSAEILNQEEDLASSGVSTRCQQYARVSSSAAVAKG